MLHQSGGIRASQGTFSSFGLATTCLQVQKLNDKDLRAGKVNFT